MGRRVFIGIPSASRFQFVFVKPANVDDIGNLLFNCQLALACPPGLKMDGNFLNGSGAALDDQFQPDFISYGRNVDSPFPHLPRQSEKAGQCNALIDELRAKLQKKDYEIAMLYYRMDRYQAAVTSFDILLNAYPDTQYREEVMYFSIRAYFDFANQSVREKRNERYQESIERYQKFISRFPDSKYAKEAMTINERSLKMISENN